MEVDRLKLMMDTSGLSIEELARRVKITSRQMRRIMNGEIKKPQAETLRSIRDVLEGAQLYVSIDASGSRLKVLRGELSDLPIVVDWFRTLSEQDRLAAISALDIYAGRVLIRAAEAVREFGNRFESGGETRKLKGSRKKDS